MLRTGVRESLEVLPRRGAERRRSIVRPIAKAVGLVRDVAMRLHVASLDAVLVAVVWQQVFALALGVALTLPARLILGAAVWLAYSADRCFDARRADADSLVTRRHRFASRHARTVFGIGCLLLPAIIALAVRSLDPRLLRSGWWLAGAVLGYVLFVQWLGRRCRAWPKELAVGVLFAAGVAWFPIGLALAEAPEPASLRVTFLGAGAFAGLCMLNCLAISRFEYAQDRRRGEAGWLDFGRLGRIVPAAGLGLAALALVGCGFAPNPGAATLFASIAASALALLALDRFSSRFESETLRLLADVALLSPVLLGIAIR